MACCRFLRLDDLESFLEDAERAAAGDNDVQGSDAEDKLGEGTSWFMTSCHYNNKYILVDIPFRS